jgi:3-phenylpropionate/cinnamic acid dioxygenase small subunit
MTATVTSTQTEEKLGPRLAFADPEFGEIYDFLTNEAALLDHDKHREWLGLVTEDIDYCLPARETVHRRDGSGIDGRGGLFQDRYAALQLRVRRNVEIEHAWDRDPPPRIRRFVTNISAYATDVENEYRVNSYILMLRSQFNLTQMDMLSAERQDVLRKTEDGWRIAKRVILIDMCTVPDPFPNVFL